MAHIDKVKEEIGWLKVIFAILLAADIPWSRGEFRIMEKPVRFFL